MPADSPARYTPWTKGVYEVAPGLRPFGTDFGNGEADQRLFQIDNEFPRYLANKRAALAEWPSKYVCRSILSRKVETAAADLIQQRLQLEYPDQKVTATTLDQLALLVPEDLVVVRTRDKENWVAYLHLCSPSHWAAKSKVGRSFFDVHAPIPGFERANAVSDGLVDAMVNKGPFVRFVWGVESDDRLNHHPDPPPGRTKDEWLGRRFSLGRFYVRTERQVIWGLPGVGAALFTIRVGHIPDHEILADESLRRPLVEALDSMSPAARDYKGLTREWDSLMKLLTP